MPKAIRGALIGCLPFGLFWLAYFYDPPGDGREMAVGLSLFILAVFLPPGALIGAILGAVLASKVGVLDTKIRDHAKPASDVRKEAYPSIAVLGDNADSGPISPREADDFFKEGGD